MVLRTAPRGIAVIVSLTITIISPIALLLIISPSGQEQEAVAQQQGNTATMNVTTTTTQSIIMPASTNKTFYVFSAEVDGLDEAAAGVPGDIFTPSVIVVNGGDSVTVHFYNTEEQIEGERHSFTIDAPPYNVDIDIAGGESGNATFTVAADQEGIFPYYCKYHLPTMVGQLVVLPSTMQPQQQQQQEEQQPETTATIAGQEEEQQDQLPTREEEEVEVQEQREPLTVTTDRESYSTGDTIMITGTVSEREPGSRVIITVIEPPSQVVWRESVSVTEDNTYQLEIQAGEPQFGISAHVIERTGTYLVTAAYRVLSAETTFEFTGEGR